MIAEFEEVESMIISLRSDIAYDTDISISKILDYETSEVLQKELIGVLRRQLVRNMEAYLGNSFGYR